MTELQPTLMDSTVTQTSESRESENTKTLELNDHPSAEFQDTVVGESRDNFERQTRSSESHLTSAEEVTTDSYFSQVKRSMTLTSLMRLGGAVAVVVAMGLYLIDGLSIEGDLERMFVAVAFTAILNVAGLLMIHALKEPRSARVFFALSLVSVPMIVTVMGALSYSIFHLDEVSSHYPDFARWTVADSSQLGLGVLGTVLVLLPVSWFALSVLARRSRGVMMLLLFAASSLLLVPLRGPIPIAVLASLAIVATTLVLQHQKSIDASLATLEGRIASTVMYLPPLILFVRALLIHGHNETFLFLIAIAVQLTMRLSIPRRKTGGAISILIAASYAAVAICTAVLAMNLVVNHWPWSLTLMLFNGLIAALFLDIGNQFDNSWVRGSLDTLAASLISFLSLTAAFESNLSVLAVAMSSLIALLIFGVRCKARAVIGISSLALCLLLINWIPDIYDWTVSAGWIGIATVGILCIAGASMIERYGANLLSLVRRSSSGNAELDA